MNMVSVSNRAGFIGVQNVQLHVSLKDTVLRTNLRIGLEPAKQSIADFA